MKRFDIPIFTKSEIGKRQAPKAINRTDLEELLRTNSISGVAKHLNVTRKTVSIWMAEYGMKSDYFKNDISKEELIEALSVNSPLEVAESRGWKLDVVTQKMKYHQIEYSPKLLTYDATVKKCQSIDPARWDNQGFIKQLKYGDPALYEAILYWTADHTLSTSKFTERVYRLQNRFTAIKVVKCRECGTGLRFFTVALAYGYSDLLICKTCWPKSIRFPDGVSKVSQELFWKIYERLPLEMQQRTWFSTLNREYKMFIRKIDHEKFVSLNKIAYHVDFFCDDRAIEFDGTYWHSRPGIQEKDRGRDEYFAYRSIPLLRVKEEEYYKTPDEVLEQCLSFLRSDQRVLAA